MSIMQRLTGNLGLTGVPAQMAHLTAVGVMFSLFAWTLTVNFKQAAEDRQLFRDELGAQRKTVEKLSRAVEHMAREMRTHK